MTTSMPEPAQSLAGLVKQCHLLARNLIESSLRAYDLGPTQWSALRLLFRDGAMTQRDLGKSLRLERATLSGLVAALVRKGLVVQLPDATDHRRRLLELTDTGRRLWGTVPDPIAEAESVAFGEASAADIAVTVRVLQDAARRLERHLAG